MREQIERNPPRRDVLERLRDLLTDLLNQVNRLLEATAAPARSGARATVPAPRRVESFVYDVSMHGQSYRVTLNEPLPRGAAGQARLHDLLMNNQLVEPGGRVVAGVDVQRTGDARYNAQPPNARLDIFRDRYLSETSSGGEFRAATDVRIAQVTPGAPARRTR